VVSTFTKRKPYRDSYYDEKNAVGGLTKAGSLAEGKASRGKSARTAYTWFLGKRQKCGRARGGACRRRARNGAGIYNREAEKAVTKIWEPSPAPIVGTVCNHLLDIHVKDLGTEKGAALFVLARNFII